MSQLHVPGQDAATVHEVLERFRRQDDNPSILVNVDMLTEGFDDPKIQSVVLARLTLSTNRFWQMIGRGTRGLAARGTSTCNVIDPVKLTRLYDYFAGYQPSFAPEDDKEYEADPEDAGAGLGQDALCPQVPSVVLPPDPGVAPYALDPDLERVQAQVALALRDFLRGFALSEQNAVQAAKTVHVAVGDGTMLLRPSAGGFDPVTAATLLHGEISNLEQRSGYDLGWFRQQLPAPLDETLLRQRMRLLRGIEALGLWTESAYAAAQMDGRLLAVLQTEAKGAAPSAPGSGLAEAATPPTEAPSMSAAESAVLDTVLAVAAADGRIVDAEIAVVLETMRRMFGRAPTPTLEAAIRARSVIPVLPQARLEATLNPGERQLLLLQMAEVAAADRVVTGEEREMLDAFARTLGVPLAYVDAVLGAHMARADLRPPTARSTSPACGGCGFETPEEAVFCPSCGARLAA